MGHPTAFSQLIELDSTRQGDIRNFDWSPDGSQITASFTSGYVETWHRNDPESRVQSTERGRVVGLKWSPDGQHIAAALYVGDIAIHRADNLLRVRVVRGGTGPVAWSSDGDILALGTTNGLVRMFGPPTWRNERVIEPGLPEIEAMAWSRPNNLLASTDKHGRVIVTTETGERVAVKYNSGRVFALTWLDDQVLVGGCEDRTIRLWNVRSNVETVLEGHIGSVVDVTTNGRILASISHDDGTIRLWDLASYEPIDIASISFSSAHILFNPVHPTLAVLGDGKLFLQETTLNPLPSNSDTIHYTNAKVVLVGDTGVGKTGLSRPLVGLEYESSKDSTHGRHVWTFLGAERSEEDGMIREAMLWDLAGQPGYRIFHRQHLDEVAVALVIFDSRSETLPFAGVSYWARSLDQAAGDFPLVKFLVAARADRFGPTVSRERIELTAQQYGFARYFETSARDGDGIAELRAAISSCIRWELLPHVSSPELFYALKRFLIAEKEAGVIAASRNELLERFSTEYNTSGISPAALDTCVGRLETVGLIKRLRFCNYILLQPELLDQYCAWIAQSARAEPDGLGVISEKRIVERDFRMDYDRALANRESDERLLIIATLEEVIGRGIAYREVTERGVMIVFPSELRADFPDYPGEYVNSIAFTFEGPVSAIYATLTVRLLNSLSFSPQALYKNAAVFATVRLRERCGYVLDYPDPLNDARGRLTVFFSTGADRDTKLLFLRYLDQQVQRLALAATFTRERVYQCEGCRNQVPPDVVKWRTARKLTRLICAFCGDTLDVDDLVEQTRIADSRLHEIDLIIASEQALQKRMAVLGEREQRGAFQVLLSYNRADQTLALELSTILRNAGVLPWIDVEQILPGESFVGALERAIDTVPVVAILLGGDTLRNWQLREYEARLTLKPSGAIIPILLPSISRDLAVESALPPLLRAMSAADFRRGFDHRGELNRLVQSIVQAETKASSALIP